MKITDVRIRLRDNEMNRMLAIVSVTLDDCFAVHDIKIIKNPNGNVFISMPSRKHNDEFVDVAHPINRETRQYFEEVILEEYYKSVNEGVE